MEALIPQIIDEMREALDMSKLGVEIDLVPKGCFISPHKDEPLTYVYYLPLWGVPHRTPVLITFYMDLSGECVWINTEQAGEFYILDEEEDEETLYEVFELLKLTGKIKWEK